MEAITVTLRVQETAYSHFWCSVFTFHRLHDAPPLLWRLHDLHSLNWRGFGFPGDGACAANARGPYEVVASIFNLEVHVV
jgi:hypothetical protein